MSIKIIGLLHHSAGACHVVIEDIVNSKTVCGNYVGCSDIEHFSHINGVIKVLKPHWHHLAAIDTMLPAKEMQFTRTYKINAHEVTCKSCAKYLVVADSALHKLEMYPDALYPCIQVHPKDVVYMFMSATSQGRSIFDNPSDPGKTIGLRLHIETSNVIGKYSNAYASNEEEMAIMREFYAKLLDACQKLPRFSSCVFSRTLA